MFLLSIMVVVKVLIGPGPSDLIGPCRGLMASGINFKIRTIKLIFIIFACLLGKY